MPQGPPLKNLLSSAKPSRSLKALQFTKIVTQMGASVQTCGFLGDSSHSNHKTFTHVFPTYSEDIGPTVIKTVGIPPLQRPDLLGRQLRIVSGLSRSGVLLLQCSLSALSPAVSALNKRSFQIVGEILVSQKSRLINILCPPPPTH